MSAAEMIHLNTMTWGQAKSVLYGTLRVLKDSSRTADLAEIEEILGQAQLDYLLAQGGFHSEEGEALLRERPELSRMNVEYLRGLPEGTFGRAVVDFLDVHGFTPEDYPTPYTEGLDEAYLLRRIRMNHDVWHALLGLGVQEHEEVLIHAFTLAQIGMPSSIGIILFGIIKHMVLEQRWSVLREDLWGAYRRGKDAKSLLPVYWEHHWEKPLDEVRGRYGVLPMA